jgi:hypothetical protein
VPLFDFRFWSFEFRSEGAIMTWYNYIASFFSGMFLANTVPHLVHGISGNRFPTPFAHPPGKGLSSPTVNVIWSLVNLVAGYALFHTGKIWTSGIAPLAVFFAGFALLSTMMSAHFAHKLHDILER